MQADGVVTAPGSLVTCCTEVSRFQQPDPRQRGAEVLHRCIRTTLKQTIERFVMVQEEADFRGESRAFGPLFQGLLGYLPGGNVTGNGFHADDRLFLDAELHALAEPDLTAVFRHGRKLQIGAGDTLGDLSLVETLR